MARPFIGKFSIVLNTKNRIVLQKDEKGAFEAKDAAKVLARMSKEASERDAELDIFQPDPAGNQPVVLASRWGTPYMALLVPQDPKTLPSKPRVIKIA